MTARAWGILAAFVVSGALWLMLAYALALALGYIGRFIGGLL